MVTKLPFLSDDHHFAIANVAVRSGQMEYHIEHLTSETLAKLPQTAEFLLKNLGADRVVGLMQRALLDHHPADAEKIEKLVSEISRLRTERNEILHWIWGKSLVENEAIHLSFRPFREPQQRTKTAREIQKIADDMMGVIHALGWWREELFRERSRRALRGTP